MTLTRHFRTQFEKRFGWVCELDDSEILELYFLGEEAGEFDEEHLLQQMKTLQEETMA